MTSDFHTKPHFYCRVGKKETRIDLSQRRGIIFAVPDWIFSMLLSPAHPICIPILTLLDLLGLGKPYFKRTCRCTPGLSSESFRNIILFASVVFICLNLFVGFLVSIAPLTITQCTVISQNLLSSPSYHKECSVPQTAH